MGSESEKGIIHEFPLSKYAKKLDSIVRKRYIEKISIIGMDPLLIPEEQLSTESFPPVEAADLVSFLVLETRAFIRRNNSRILEAFKPTTKWSPVL